MITPETLAVIEANFCEIKLEADGFKRGWIMEAWREIKRENGYIDFRLVRYEGKTIAECFDKARRG